MGSKISEERISKLKNLFQDYKEDLYLTNQKIADIIGIERTTVNKYFKKLFGEEYKHVAKIKSRTIKSFNNEEANLKRSLASKGKPKPPRTLQHRINLTKSLSRSYVERFGEERAKRIGKKISFSNKGKKRNFRNKELWKLNLSNSLKGRKVWNKGEKGLQKAWNKKYLPSQDIINLYVNQDLSTNKIANIYNVSCKVVLRILKENSIVIRGSKGFLKGKNIYEIMGQEKAKEKIKKLSKSAKNRKITWGNEISKALKKYYEECNLNGYKIVRKGKPKTYEQRQKLSKIHKEYLKQHPEELERLKKIQYPGGITKTERKFLNFLREKFKENEEFFFDKQDITGKTFYRPDFQFPKQNIIIELDGYYKHFTTEGFKKDKIREFYLKKAGWKIYRFNYYDIDRNYKFEKTKNKVNDILVV